MQKKRSGKFISSVKKLFDRKHKPLLHTVEWVFVLIAFFAIGFPVIYFQSMGNISREGKLNYIGNRKAAAPSAETVKEFTGETVEEPIVDMTGWDTYRNKLYGFEIKHPDSWTNMQFKTATAKNARYETIYKFRKDASGENDPYIGFDVAVYSTKKAGSVELTNDVQKKEEAPTDVSGCHFSEDTALGEEGSIFQKVSIGQGDACYDPAYFFSVNKNNYLYDIIPVAKVGMDPPADLEKDVSKNFPEYKEVVASFKNIPTERAAVTERAVSRPVPTFKSCHLSGGKVIGGRIVCPVKNDHPHNSPTKGHHMDEDCCMDPDESRNPCCSY